MSRLEVLCVTMNQKDFSIVEKLNLKSDAIIANQANQTSIIEKSYSWGKVKLVSSNTVGVGKNRNIAFLHASGEILLLSDEDMHFSDSYVEDVLEEFDKHKDADVFIFNIKSTGVEREQKQNNKTKPISIFSRMPYGAPRIAIRKNAWERSNVWFSLLFGGGTKYSNGEDSIFLNDIKKNHLRIYVSNKCIGFVDMSNSSWFKGTDQTFFFNKGAYIAKTHRLTKQIWWLYHALRSQSKLSIVQRLQCLRSGSADYQNEESKVKL